MAESHRSIAIGIGAIAVAWIGVYWGWSPKTPGVTFAGEVDAGSESRSAEGARDPVAQGVREPLTTAGQPDDHGQPRPGRPAVNLPVVIDQSGELSQPPQIRTVEESSDGGKPAVPASGRIHVVRSGESLSSIAKAEYGKASLYMAIFEANRDILKSPDDLRLGQRLVLPDIE